MNSLDRKLLQALTAAPKPWADHTANFERLRRLGLVYKQITRAGDYAKITNAGRDALHERAG